MPGKVLMKPLLNDHGCDAISIVAAGRKMHGVSNGMGRRGIGRQRCAEQRQGAHVVWDNRKIHNRLAVDGPSSMATEPMVSAPFHSSRSTRSVTSAPSRLD